MSGPSLETRKRWREQAQGVCLEFVSRDERGEPITYWGRSSFNVRAARVAALALLHLADEQAVFEDWTRSKGLGPESGHKFALDEWGRLYGPARVGMRGFNEQHDNFTAAGWTVAIPSILDELVPVYKRHGGGWPGRLAREWPGDSRAPMGRSLARLGRRVLESLEGQPDECERCKGGGWVRESGFVDEEATAAREDVHRGSVCEAMPGLYEWLQHCPDCHGTGDNLQGYLPEVEETAQERWKAGRSRHRQLITPPGEDDLLPPAADGP